MNAIGSCNIANGVDGNGHPTGGRVDGVGLSIVWQDGPLGRHAPTCGPGKPCTAESGCTRRDPNGAFVETVISAALQRLAFYQKAAGGKFACFENEMAIEALAGALKFLEHRTITREQRQVEGTHIA